MKSHTEKQNTISSKRTKATDFVILGSEANYLPQELGQHWHKNRYINQMNTTDSEKNLTYLYLEAFQKRNKQKTKQKTPPTMDSRKGSPHSNNADNPGCPRI